MLRPLQLHVQSQRHARCKQLRVGSPWCPHWIPGGQCQTLKENRLLTYLQFSHAAARTRLRKLLAAKEASGANGSQGTGVAAGAPAERSPHTKSSYDVSEFETLTGKYEGLKWRMISKPGGAIVKPDDFYR